MFTPQLADYDGDGRVDLITGSDCCQKACFYVFRRQKDGGFAPRQQVKPIFPPEQFGQVRVDAFPSRVAVADLNGDGKPDVLIGGHMVKYFGVVYGPLGGKDELTLQRMWPAGQEPFAPGPLATNPVLADWDGDGLSDLILGLGSPIGGVYWCRNVGTKRAPTFAKSQVLVARDPAITGVCVADWNGDGRMDLFASRMYVVSHEGKLHMHHKVWVYLRRGG